MKKLIGTAVALLLVGGAVLPASAKPAPKPVTVFEDAAGDAGNQDGGLPGFSEAGLDLVKGEITQESKTEITFTVTHAAMPASGPPGEGLRFIWGFAVDGTQYEFTVKSIDVGDPDVITTALTQDPHGEERIGQVYQGVARLEECGSVQAPVLSFATCDAKAYYAATFESDTATMTWTVDTKALGAKKGSTIVGGSGSRAGTGCMICWVPHYLERSLTPHTIIDSAVQSGAFKVR
ncbi:MAG: hypothetical protein M3271_12185 [Actinomycetota bacterium]|nr:hypothetical protein [Actinomycetota bacterium]